MDRPSVRPRGILARPNQRFVLLEDSAGRSRIAGVRSDGRMIVKSVLSGERRRKQNGELCRGPARLGNTRKNPVQAVASHNCAVETRRIQYGPHMLPLVREFLCSIQVDRAVVSAFRYEKNVSIIFKDEWIR
jgi:hypothetical protein